METKIRRQAGAQSSPERPRPWPEPPPSRKLQSKHQQQQQPVRRIPVVYYLSKNHHLEHPHFIEVPVSSPDGLYLRDVINRLVVLRGRRMPGMYSWSCKRGYKNGFVWHDLSEDDLILPVHGNEYVLKGSELLDRTPSDRGRDTGSNLKVEKWNASPKQEGSPHPSWETGSPSLADYRVVKLSGAIDASTQTDDNGGTKPRERGRRRATRATDEILELESEERHFEENQRSKELSGAAKNVLSPPPLSASPLSSYGKIDTLESLIREDARKMNRFRILEEEEVFVPTRVKMKATNLLMQLITCGAISVKDHRSLGLIPTYKPSYSHMNVSPSMFANSVLLGEHDSPLEAPSFMGARMEEKECFSGALLETMNYKEGFRKGPPNLQQSSYDENRDCVSPNLEDEDKEVGSHRSKCLPRPFRVTAVKPSSRNEALLSPASDVPKNTFAASICNQSRYLGSSHGGSNRISDSSSARGSSIRLESLREEKGKVIKIEERLTSGARVIIQSRAPLSDSDDSAGSC
ncbi:protein UPSTREAM OF FLC-like isoform X2 [Dioscorea cayenensis subsp. rotundata]|uniref:Protein UPSTREAM OF FLC-like isoform X2 n=1 Tax=Dioscorea cayennensis subsp. rotundata TaxID=55577 RepID=A0AB40C5B4_DIOCR|nr:protein UPSTREAM OF FLC-like isoform X2 [Dioscorea cayenensis subsp. rotundata]